MAGAGAGAKAKQSKNPQTRKNPIAQARDKLALKTANEDFPRKSGSALQTMIWQENDVIGFSGFESIVNFMRILTRYSTQSDCRIRLRFPFRFKHLKKRSQKIMDKFQACCRLEFATPGFFDEGQDFKLAYSNFWDFPHVGVLRVFHAWETHRDNKVTNAVAQALARLSRKKRIFAGVKSRILSGACVVRL